MEDTWSLIFFQGRDFCFVLFFVGWLFVFVGLSLLLSVKDRNQRRLILGNTTHGATKRRARRCPFHLSACPSRRKDTCSTTPPLVPGQVVSVYVTLYTYYCLNKIPTLEYVNTRDEYDTYFDTEEYADSSVLSVGLHPLVPVPPRRPCPLGRRHLTPEAPESTEDRGLVYPIH